MSSIFTELQQVKAQQQQELHGAGNALPTPVVKKPKPKKEEQADMIVSQEFPQETSQETSRKTSQARTRYPTKEEMEEFNWRLRNEPIQKFTTELPAQWMEDMKDIAYRTGVKKLELYRFIIGEFLGKVKRSK